MNSCLKYLHYLILRVEIVSCDCNFHGSGNLIEVVGKFNWSIRALEIMMF